MQLLPPPLRRSRFELPPLFSFNEMIKMKMKENQQSAEVDRHPDEEWWDRLRGVVASREKQTPQTNSGIGSGIEIGIGSCDDLVEARLLWGDPLVQAGRKYKNNWQLPLLWPSSNE